MADDMSYVSYCWSLGTTSFRTRNFNKTIEEQLRLLYEFWQLPENENNNWASNMTLQSRYYDFMKAKGFVGGEAKYKSKDAREKTSGLVDIGLISYDRKLTEAGKILLDISNKNDFSSDNILQIDKDSYIYLKQLLKTSCVVNGKVVRPFIVLVYLLSKLDYLTIDEYTYLLPLCIDEISTQNMVQNIVVLRQGKANIDDIIIDTLMSMRNYKSALDYFQKNVVTQDLICTIGMNRKSAGKTTVNPDSKKYDISYFDLYQAMYGLYVVKDKSYIVKLYEAIQPLKLSGYWRKMFFDSSSPKAIFKAPESHWRRTDFDRVQDESDLKDIFFKTMHLYKAKATLHDYLDLNRRYVKTTDVILFEDNQVKLDVIPKYLFKRVLTDLQKIMYKQTDLLYKNCKIDEILPSLSISEQEVVEIINQEFGNGAINIESARNILENNRYTRLRHMIDKKFTDADLIVLLDLFETRKDSDIRKLVTEDADIPTIFEYVLGIIWYKVSDYKGKILDYMKLSLNADLLPKTHAAGGEADIVYEYSQTEDYPQHTLLLEATLADSTNQRRMEMEPVSRHLGQHIIRTNNMQSYCVFATNNLNINVISDFRGRKYNYFYDAQDNTKWINSMKIIPLQIRDLKNIIKSGKKYPYLYNIFEKAYNSSLPPKEWYEQEIADKM